MASKNIGGGRPLRVCDLCGGVDDHPRHVVAGNVRGVFTPSDGALERVMADAPEGQRNQLVRELMDTTSSDRHLDCCAAAGCPDGSCPVMVEGSGKKTGRAMFDHLMEVGPERMEIIRALNDVEQGA